MKIHGILAIIISLIILLTIPTTIGTLWYHYLPSRPPSKVSNEELEALEFLSNQSDGVVLTLPFDKNAADAAVNNPPRPLYLYESTAYVSAFSNKPVYLEDEVNLDITGYDWRERRKEVSSFFESPSVSFLADNNITYIYLTRSQIPTVSSYEEKFEEIFVNNEVSIFRVN